jgi:tetratricopeptide (TPR) repeat protein
MRRRLVAFALSAVVLVFAVHLAAQRRGPSPAAPLVTYSLTGMVLYNDGYKPAERIKVDLQSFTGQTVSAFTDGNGEFQFSGLPQGLYYLLVQEPGYLAIQESVDITGGDRRGLTLYLRKIATPGSAKRGASVSVRQLSIPTEAREAFREGRRHLREKDAKGSVAHFQQAIERFAGYYEAYQELGLAYWELDQTEQADQAFRKSIELSPGAFPNPRYSLAALLCSQRKFQEAETCARQAVAIDANSWEGYFYLARALLGLNRAAEADKSIQQARSLKPDSPKIYLLSADIHIRTKDDVALLKDLREYLRLAPNGPKSQQARAMRERLMKKAAAAQNQVTPSPAKP